MSDVRNDEVGIYKLLSKVHFEYAVSRYGGNPPVVVSVFCGEG